MAKSRLEMFGDTAAACSALVQKDKSLARALDVIGAPVIRRRAGGFEGLFRIIVEQQVSVASAQAIWKRCTDGLETVTPTCALHQGEERLRSFGLSGPKVRYVIALGEALENGALDLTGLALLGDDEASAMLQSVKGIGPWTAAIYLLFCEGRSDIWPPGDVALLGAYRNVFPNKAELGMKNLDKKACHWSPYRGLAAHILWTYYAHMRGRTPI